MTWNGDNLLSDHFSNYSTLKLKGLKLQPTPEVWKHPDRRIPAQQKDPKQQKSNILISN